VAIEKEHSLAVPAARGVDRGRRRMVGFSRLLARKVFLAASSGQHRASKRDSLEL
jgi:hypothetical protein